MATAPGSVMSSKRRLIDAILPPDIFRFKCNTFLWNPSAEEALV